MHEEYLDGRLDCNCGITNSKAKWYDLLGFFIIFDFSIKNVD